MCIGRNKCLYFLKYCFGHFCGQNFSKGDAVNEVFGKWALFWKKVIILDMRVAYFRINNLPLKSLKELRC